MARKLYHAAGHHHNFVNHAVFIESQKALITVADDKTMMLWLMRADGSFWPSVHQTLLAEASSLIYDEATRRLFVGTGLGTIVLYNVAVDYNSVILEFTINAHGGRVEAMVLDKERDRIVSVGKDKTLKIHNAAGGAVIATHGLSNFPSALVYDNSSLTMFVGDTRGAIYVLRQEGTVIRELSVLEGHSAHVSCLYWEPTLNVLMSGSHDHLVMVWDIGGGKGTCFELTGHSNKVQGLHYLTDQKKLISVGQDGAFIVWDMLARRLATPEWHESGKCEICDYPFLWNVKAMFSIKAVSFTRQHHCRKCGKAVCHTCSSTTSRLTRLGFEHPVRVCKECGPVITDDDRQPFAKFSHGSSVYRMSVSSSPSRLVTCNYDYSISVWDIESVLQGGMTAEEFKKAPKTYSTASSSPSHSQSSAASSAKGSASASRPKGSDLLSSILDEDD